MFADLLNNPRGISPADLQSQAIRDFSLRIRASHFDQRLPGDALPARPFVLLGVASYSPAELRLLDEIESNFADWQGSIRVLVFDTATCKTLIELRQLAPGLGEVRQTPIIGIGKVQGPVLYQAGLPAVREELERQGLVAVAPISARA